MTNVTNYITVMYPLGNDRRSMFTSCFDTYLPFPNN